MLFIDNLIQKIKLKGNPTVMGIDPKMEYIPDSIKEKAFKEAGKTFESAAYCIFEFNKRLIDAVYDIVPAVKPQLAYFEMYGIDGMKAFKKTVEYAKSKDLLVIADGKRNDIGSTAEAYSTAFLGKTYIDSNTSISAYDVDALTVNPYFGVDGVQPFINDCVKYKKGIFVLAKTSNLSSGQLQDIITDEDMTVYETVAELTNEWGQGLEGENGYCSIGSVVGATYPEQLKILRKMMKKSYILVPGYGTQGGTAKDVANAFNKDGLGAIVNASRSLMCAYNRPQWSDKYNKEMFDEACREEAIRMKEDIVSVIK